MRPSNVTLADLVDRAMRDGFTQRDEATHAVESVLAAFAGCFAPSDAATLAGCLSHRLAHIVTEAPHGPDDDAEVFFARVRAREGVTAPLAREHVWITLRALAESLDPVIQARLSRALSPALAEMFAPRGRVAPRVNEAHRDAPSLHTLASGRPGSLHPVSESAPPAAQTHSVVREENPHGDSKVSSAAGLTQEQLHASLATGREPKPDRAVSDANDTRR